MATAEMSLPDKKPEHESGYYEGSDQEGSMECGCPSPVSSRNSSHSTKLKRRHSAHKHKKVPTKKLKTDQPVNGHNIHHIDKSVEIVEYTVSVNKKVEEPVPGPSKRSSSVELIGGTVPAPARDSVDWNLVEASKIRKRSKVNLNGASKVDISHFDLLKVLGTGGKTFNADENGFHVHGSPAGIHNAGLVQITNVFENILEYSPACRLPHNVFH
ncbi:jg11610 [Pararge aegeria aegeria]|uniref:Jg11610 protein n=1 Tax=Pararge aegeria aegeria TaxID=348720 RepID=A0A8S4RCM6_9NEOP|nr:jg11610 [Pararge aegeria aegeria]